MSARDPIKYSARRHLLNARMQQDTRAEVPPARKIANDTRTHLQSCVRVGLRDVSCSISMVLDGEHLERSLSALHTRHSMCSLGLGLASTQCQNDVVLLFELGLRHHPRWSHRGATRGA